VRHPDFLPNDNMVNTQIKATFPRLLRAMPAGGSAYHGNNW
jgi:hypothetical protein